MESLDLPYDLIWEGKPEPISPLQLPIANAEDVLIFDDDNFADDILLYGDLLRSAESFDIKKSPIDLLLDLEKHLLDDDDDSDAIDDELGNQWLDESINLPVLVDYPILTHSQPIKVAQTAQLLREFDTVLDNVELTHLTPPQTPPLTPPGTTIHRQLNLHQIKQNAITILPSTIQPIAHITLSNSQTNILQQTNVLEQETQPSQQQQYYVYESVPTPAVQSPMSQDVALEMEIVEDLVRSRAEQLPDWTDDDDSASTSSSIDCSPRSESSSYYTGGSLSSSSSYSNDDEWSPKRATITGTIKRKSKPYSRSLEDKKSRKKEQNKNAATRYRQKKKQEVEIVFEEERVLQEKHDKLQVKYSDVKREINYLKSLMRDLYRAKGIL